MVNFLLSTIIFCLVYFCTPFLVPLLVSLSGPLSTLFPDPNNVTTPSGTISGKTVTYNGMPVTAFLGIPYVKPPLGELRFKRPIPIEPWTTTLKANSLPPGCPQESPNHFLFRDDYPGLSEDCLYLNIWTPVVTKSMKKKSVMFWIHGGGFTIGSSRLDYYDGRALAVDGDVIVVTTNYRLGALGFFYSATDDAPGNMGMLDLVEALKWVRINIEAFGGDKNSITLFGHSAGGIAIGMFCVSPATRGLFKRVILQSGASTFLDGGDNNKSFRTSQKLAEDVGCADSETALKDKPKQVMKCMRDVNATELISKLSAISAGNLRSYYPRFGDELFPKDPRQSVIDGDFDPVEVLIGTNNGDGSDFITSSMKNVFGFFGQKDPQINLTFGESIIRERFKNLSDPDSVVKLYLGGLKEDDYDTVRAQVLNAEGDYQRICPSNYFAERFAQKSSKVYYYFFTHRPSPSPFASWMLAVHFDETPFVFGYPLRYPANYTVPEELLSRRMMQSWSSFAKTGSPQDSLWPLYLKQNPEFQKLDVNALETGNGPHPEKCDFFRPYFGF